MIFDAKKPYLVELDKEVRKCYNVSDGTVVSIDLLGADPCQLPLRGSCIWIRLKTITGYPNRRGMSNKIIHQQVNLFGRYATRHLGGATYFFSKENINYGSTIDSR